MSEITANPEQAWRRTVSMSSAASWLWQSSADWHAYPPAVCAQLDAARARGDGRVPLDGGRHVRLPREIDARRNVGERRPTRAAAAAALPQRDVAQLAARGHRLGAKAVRGADEGEKPGRKREGAG